MSYLSDKEPHLNLKVLNLNVVNCNTGKSEVENGNPVYYYMSKNIWDGV